MASFDENGKYIKTNWKAGDKITATKLNKIEESIEAVNDNDISRYDEMRDKFIILEAKDAEHDKELANIEGLVLNNKAETDLGIQSLESGMNALESDIQTLESDVAELKVTDEAVKNDMNNAQTQTFTVTDAYKFTVDHDGMMSSLLTLDNIEGLSSIETNTSNQKRLVSTWLHDVCTIDTSRNYFEDAVFSHVGNDAQYSKEGNNVRVWGSSDVGYMLVGFSIPTLVEGKTYCIICDNIEVTSGSPAIQVPGINLGLAQCRNGYDIDVSGLSAIFVYSVDGIILFHSGVQQQNGDVTYENIQIYEVKEIIVPDVRLNSLPNGIKDEIKDGMLIKRTKYVNLAELTWIPSSTNVQFPESEFVVYYTPDTPDLIVDPNAWENEIGVILCNNIPSAPIVVTNSADPSVASNNRVGISGHKAYGEMRIKLYKSDAPDLAAFKTWLTENRVYAIYELETPECIPVNTTIKADKGDTVVINTTKTMDFAYDIQLNTRAQIDALQKTAANTDRITSELRAADAALQDNIKYELRYDQHGNGYYILPGGLTIQFGYITFPANYSSSETIDFILTFPVPFPNQVISVITSMSGGDNGWDSRVSGHATSKSHARIVIRGLNYAITNTMYWFVIGR